MATTTNGTQSKSIVIPELKLREIEVEVEGVSPYISHSFSEKARKQMRDKQYFPELDYKTRQIENLCEEIIELYDNEFENQE